MAALMRRMLHAKMLHDRTEHGAAESVVGVRLTVIAAKQVVTFMLTQQVSIPSSQTFGDGTSLFPDSVLLAVMRMKRVRRLTSARLMRRNSPMRQPLYISMSTRRASGISSTPRHKRLRWRTVKGCLRCRFFGRSISTYRE